MSKTRKDEAVGIGAQNDHRIVPGVRVGEDVRIAAKDSVGGAVAVSAKTMKAAKTCPIGVPLARETNNGGPWRRNFEPA